MNFPSLAMDGGNTFSATMRSSDFWRALKTAPIAPWPILVMTSNPPTVLIFWPETGLETPGALVPLAAAGFGVAEEGAGSLG
jgi:hypothetical protein